MPSNTTQWKPNKTIRAFCSFFLFVCFAICVLLYIIYVL